LARARSVVNIHLTRAAAIAPVGESPKIRALFEATYLAGLRKAGVPEE
jgi:hypothetical protein